MGKIIKRPNDAITEAQRMKTEALRVMSLDMSSSAGFKAFNRKGYSTIN